ncbi:MAG: YncE family protein [Terriglobia bacterium]|jgi:DNA-binding beta-propeller fold protein YncE
MRVRRLSLRIVACTSILLFAALHASAQTPSEALLVLAKSDESLAIVDPVSLHVVGRAPSGPDPHEVIASADGKLAYISNYGGSDSDLNTISVVDLVSQKALPAINLGALHSAHGLAFAGGKLYFTVETNKTIGRYDPTAGRVDWVMGTGQDRTHMVWVSKNLEQLVTSNVNSATISIIERISPPGGGFGPPPGAPPGTATPPGFRPSPGGPRKTWEVTNVRAGRGCEGFDVSPDGKEIWAANARDATVTIIDFAAKRATQTIHISVNGANRLKFTPDGARVFVSGLGFGGRSGNDLVVIDATSRKEIKHFDLGGGAAGILMDPHGSRAFVAVSGKDYVAVVDLKSLEVTGRISVGKQPDGLAWAVRK